MWCHPHHITTSSLLCFVSNSTFSEMEKTHNGHLEDIEMGSCVCVSSLSVQTNSFSIIIWLPPFSRHTHRFLKAIGQKNVQTCTKTIVSNIMAHSISNEAPRGGEFQSMEAENIKTNNESIKLWWVFVAWTKLWPVMEKEFITFVKINHKAVTMFDWNPSNESEEENNRKKLFGS